MARFTTSDGLSLEYIDEGQGDPLLCLPGLTRNASDFDELAAALDGRRRLIRLTSRGRGRSDYDPNFMNYAIPIEARDAVELLDHLGVSRAVIVGTSRGGFLAMVLAATVKDRLAGVLLNDIGPEVGTDGLDDIKSYLGKAPTAETAEEVARALKTRMEAGFPTLSDARWLELAERWFPPGPDGRPALDYDPKLADAVEAALVQPAPDMWPLFDALTDMPLAVVRGEHSNILSAETLARMQARRPDLIVAEVPDRGHVPFLDEPEALRALEAMLARASI